jgi:hypothetical protein
MQTTTKKLQNHLTDDAIKGLLTNHDSLGYIIDELVGGDRMAVDLDKLLSVRKQIVDLMITDDSRSVVELNNHLTQLVAARLTLQHAQIELIGL